MNVEIVAAMIKAHKSMNLKQIFLSIQIILINLNKGVIILKSQKLKHFKQGEEIINKYKKHVSSIKRIQAIWRGKLDRKKNGYCLTNWKSFKKNLSKIPSNSTYSTQFNQNPNSNKVINVSSYQFNNGGIYTGSNKKEN